MGVMRGGRAEAAATREGGRGGTRLRGRGGGQLAGGALAAARAGRSEGDMHIPKPTQVTPTLTTPHRPLTRSQAKKLQQELHALLCETHFKLNENYILPKSCTLLLLRFIKEYDKNVQGEVYEDGSCSKPASPAEPSERNLHSF
jgi:hypothetical protein